MYRKDRGNQQKTCGGGVFILVRKNFISSEIKINSDCELIFVDLKLTNQQNVKIGCLYRPPWTDDTYMEKLGDALQQLDPQQKGNIWLGGDFNLPKIDWIDLKVTPQNPDVKLSNMLINTANDFFLSQVVNHPTRKDNILDLFFTSNPSLINRVTTAPPLSIEADHNIVFIDVNSRAVIPKRAPQPRFIYAKADWESMRKHLAAYKLPESSVQEQWDHFESTIISLMKKYIPQKIPRPQKHKPWISREIITMIHRRNRAYKSWQTSKSSETHTKYHQLRSKCQKKIRKAHKEYMNNIFNLENTEREKSIVSKRFWTYVKSKKRDSCSISPLRSEGLLISDAIGKGNILNQQYFSVFSKPEYQFIPAMANSTSPTIPKIVVTDKGVLKMLQDLNPHKASGPDRISPKVLKELALPLSKPLAKMFQHSVDTGIVPKQWKKAVVSPIFKKGDRNQASNYRPVSLTAVCCKLCEHLIAKAIMNHLEENKLLSDNQHGFRKNRSCESQLIQFVDDLARNMCDGNQIDIAVMDFSKAFDVVPHKRLLTKLEYYGIQGNILSWIEDFLSDRTQQVVVDGESSDIAQVTSGVPQGSVLGPILFLAFINDMPDCVNSSCRLFADDSIIYRNVNSENDARVLQQDLDALHKWETEWGMRFNPSKCHVLQVTRKKNPLHHVYTLKGIPLENVPEATYLGVDISNKLSWHKHTSKVAAKGNRALGFVKRNIRTTSRKTKELAYNTLVRPTVEYASTVWSPHQQELIKNIEMVQRRSARYVMSQYDRHDSVTDMLRRLSWETLEQRRLKARVVMGYRIIHGLVKIPDNQLVPSSAPTRGHNWKLRQISVRTNYYKSTFFPSLIPLWNSLPSTVASAAELEDFKIKLADVYLTIPRS